MSTNPSKVGFALLIFAALAAGQTPTSISALNPSSAPVGSPPTPLTITGQNIASGSTISWTAPNGRTVTLTPSLIQAAQLAATIPAVLLSTAGTAQVAVSNAGILSNQLPFNISQAPLAVTPASLPMGSPGSAYGPVTLAAIGGTPPYTWAPSGGQIPGGLGLSPAGVLSGTPVTPNTYQFGVKVTDSTGATASGLFTIPVVPASLKITTPSTLPASVVGAQYPSQILTAAGGTPPYSFAITGSLPSGLTLTNGEIDGTPLSAGPFSFIVTATDSSTPPLTASSTELLPIQPANPPTLVIGGTSAAFSIAAGSTGLPPAVAIPVSSSNVAQIIGYSTAVNPLVPWLTVSSPATTPGRVSIALSNQALSLAASTTPYQTSVVLTCASSNPCAGSSQTIGVSVTVTGQAPQLSVGPALLSFLGSATNPPAPQLLGIQNTGGGSLQIVSITAADPFVTVGTFPQFLAGGPATPVTITASPTGLNPGYHRSTVNVVTSNGAASVPVTLYVSNNSILTLGPAGTQFTMAAGGVLGNPNGSFAVDFTGSAPGFTASVLPGAPWLSIQSQTANSVNFTINPGVAAGLAAGTHYGTIRITASGVINSPQDFLIILTIAPAASPALPDPEPAGLLFIATGATAPPAQTLRLFASSAAAVQYQASASTTSGNSWLTVTPTSGTTSAGSPSSPTVTVSPAGLGAGVYRGGITYQYAGSAVRTVNVTFIIPSGSASSSAVPGRLPVPGPLSISDAVAACTPAQLVPVQSGPVTDFAAPTSWPMPLAFNLSNDCGGVVSNGQVTVAFSNGDPPMGLALINAATGLYEGTWTPRNPSSQVTITATAEAPGFPAAAMVQIAGQVKPNVAPAIAPNGVFQIFDPFMMGAALAPGNVIQIYGVGFAAQTSTPPLPLPLSAAGTSVIIGGMEAPLFFVGPGQIDAQVPFELPAGNQYQVIVNANNAFSTGYTVQVNAVAPNILPFPAATEQLVAQRGDGSLVSDAAPAKPGEFLVLYLAGMGLTDDSVVMDGVASPGGPLANALSQPTVTMDSEPVFIQFAGLTPTVVGLYQVNFQVPTDASDGNHQIVLSQSGTAANTTILPVHH